MFTFSMFRCVALLGFVVTLFVLPQQTAMAQKSGPIKASAVMSGIKAVAKYEERGTRRKFNFELEKAAARQTYTVTATTNGKTVTMGTFVVNGLGRGIIDIDTREGDFVHDLAVGSRITLMASGRSYSGVLR